MNTSDQLTPEQSVNAFMLKKGFVKLDKGVKLSEKYESFKKFEETAYDKKSGAW